MKEVVTYNKQEVSGQIGLAKVSGMKNIVSRSSTGKAILF